MLFLKFNQFICNYRPALPVHHSQGVVHITNHEVIPCSPEISNWPLNSSQIHSNLHQREKRKSDTKQHKRCTCLLPLDGRWETSTRNIIQLTLVHGGGDRGIRKNPFKIIPRLFPHQSTPLAYSGRKTRGDTTHWYYWNATAHNTRIYCNVMLWHWKDFGVPLLPPRLDWWLSHLATFAHGMRPSWSWFLWPCF